MYERHLCRPDPFEGHSFWESNHARSVRATTHQPRIVGIRSQWKCLQRQPSCGNYGHPSKQQVRSASMPTSEIGGCPPKAEEAIGHASRQTRHRSSCESEQRKAGLMVVASDQGDKTMTAWCRSSRSQRPVMRTIPDRQVDSNRQCEAMKEEQRHVCRQA